MRRWMVVGPAMLVAASGCLATKGDIALLQDELRVQRAQLTADSLAAARADEARRGQLASISSQVRQSSDSLRVLMTRLSSFQATATGEFDQIGRELVQMQALMGQSVANMQKTQLQLEALREQGLTTSAPPPAAPTVSDSTQPGQPGQPPAAGTPPAGPGPATLYSTGQSELTQGAYATARMALQQLIDTYPTYEFVSHAQLYIGESYAADGNTAAADSVYQVVVSKYPKTDDAATALYKRGQMLWDAGKQKEATPILQRVLSDYPGTDAAKLAEELLKGR